MNEVLNQFQEFFRYKGTFFIDTKVFTKSKKQNFKILLQLTAETCFSKVFEYNVFKKR